MSCVSTFYHLQSVCQRNSSSLDTNPYNRTFFVRNFRRLWCFIPRKLNPFICADKNSSPILHVSVNAPQMESKFPFVFVWLRANKTAEMLNQKKKLGNQNSPTVVVLICLRWITSSRHNQEDVRVAVSLAPTVYLRLRSGLVCDSYRTFVLVVQRS